MKKANLILLAFAVFVSASAMAQDQAKPEDAKPASTRTQGTGRKALTMSGRVSEDGKAIVSDDDDIWDVSNSKVLTGHEGQQVTVKCQVSVDKNEIRVLSLKTAQGEVKYVANRGDSAFRR